MKPDDLDVAGFAVGVVERGNELGAPSSARKATCCSAFGSPGLRSNGYTLARTILVANAREPRQTGLSRERRERSVEDCWNRQ